MIIALVIFWLSVLAMVHSYVLFPFILSILARGKSLSSDVYTIKAGAGTNTGASILLAPQNESSMLLDSNNLPHVYIIMAVFNEEAVLKEKVESIYQTSYPQDKLHVLIGSDASTDGTNTILEAYKNFYPQSFTPMLFKGRSGKIKINNTLFNTVREEAKQGVVIMTDANVIFSEHTIFQLVKRFKDPATGLVGANVLSRKARKEGIAYQEMSYINRENIIKYNEGLIWGCMMGAFGACYAVRGDLFVPAPENFRSDDFFLTLHILAQGKKALCELDAICYEDASNDIHEEYKRKVRISVGNYQNLQVHKGMLWPPFSPVAFCFWSHKVLRWLGPFFILLAYVSNIFLLNGNKFYQLTFIMQTIFLLSPVLDGILKKLGIHTVLLRFIAYFYYMNLAMLVGLIKFLRGGIDNVWQPTKRNQ